MLLIEPMFFVFPLPGPSLAIRHFSCNKNTKVVRD